MQLRQALNSAIDRLTAEHVPSPRMNAELLLMFTLDCDRAYLYGHPERELSADETRRYDAALSRRAAGVPAQYITGHQEFWGLDLIVSPAVLIPRPETEHVVEAVLELAGRTHHHEGQPSTPLRPGSGARRAGPSAMETSRLRIVDVGTGSGAIAFALAHELISAGIDATDISAAALEVAQANAARLQMSSRVRFHHADLLTGLPHAHYDFVVSNPPYVGEAEEDTVQLEVRKHEPRNAVFGGPTGVEVIERVLPQAATVLRPGGWLVFEISGTIAERVRELLSGWEQVSLGKDLQGIPRVAIGRKPGR